jgi:hypothetical protein
MHTFTSYIKEGNNMLYTIAAILIILWLLGFIGQIGGGFIHILLVIAAIVIIYNFFMGRRTHTQ